LEMPFTTIWRRINQIITGMGLSPESLADLNDRFAVRTLPALRFNGELVDRLQNDLEPVDLVIVDSFRKALDGTENDVEAVAQFWEYVDSLTKMQEKSFVMTHHAKKAGAYGRRGDPTEWASGSTYVLGGADATFSIDRRTADVVVIEQTKGRSGPELSPFIVNCCGMSDTDGPVVMRFEDFRAERPRVPKKTRAVELITDFLRASPDGKADTRAIHSHVTAQGIGKRTSEDALEDMRVRGLVVPLERGVWQLSEAGKA
jgi:AAA domain